MYAGTSAGLNWIAEVSTDPTKITFTGEFDLAAANGLKESLDDVLSDVKGPVVIDLDLEFMDSTGLRFLLDLKRTLDGRGLTLVLDHLSPAVERVLEVAGLSSFFATDPDTASTS